MTFFILENRASTLGLCHQPNRLNSFEKNESLENELRGRERMLYYVVLKMKPIPSTTVIDIILNLIQLILREHINAIEEIYNVNRILYTHFRF
jgi:hypothetical protein